MFGLRWVVEGWKRPEMTEARSSRDRAPDGGNPLLGKRVRLRENQIVVFDDPVEGGAGDFQEPGGGALVSFSFE